MDRRDFIVEAGRATGMMTAALAAPAAAARDRGSGPEAQRRISLVSDPSDPVASAPPAAWALQELAQALTHRGFTVERYARIDQAPARSQCIAASGPQAPGRDLLPSGVSLPEATESLVLAKATAGNRPILLASGRDPVGLTYALLEIADRVALAQDPAASLALERPLSERPANPIRSAMRLFVSEVEDKSWFTDRSFWERYLSMLAAERFNRFHLAFGIGYDFLRDVTDAYLHFAYPFLLSVPGYSVRAKGLPAEEQARNLETLRFISDAAARRGLHFQLGLWTHGYEYEANPGATYPIEGLTRENHAAYCRDALALLLRECPSIGGVTFRIHGESGVAEGSYAFWKTVFEGVVRSGRTVEIDMHAKGIDQELIDLALATGMPVTVSPKFWAEHMGLPYHQAAIRPLEMPPREARDEGFFALSGGSRKFLRYGYGDLLREDRRYRVLHRIWPGTQRLLLWGDPQMAAAYSRAAGFCDSAGIDLFEPLSFKGRKSSGLPGGRDGYTDGVLKPSSDWEKYRTTYRLWGRLLYNPDTEPEVWRRLLRRDLGSSSGDAEQALGRASRILPLVTTAHDPSAANNNYWPEMYTNMPVVDAGRPHPYGDSPSPKLFGTVSPLDPKLFATIDEYVTGMIQGRESAKHSPVEVAHWLDGLAAAVRSLERAREKGDREAGPEGAPFRRLALDVELQCGLGRFFARKLRAGVLWSFYERTGHSVVREQALQEYRAARDAWRELSQKAQGAYRPDLTFGRVAHLRGHWTDRLAAIESDLADMEKRTPVDHVDSRAVPAERLEATLRALLAVRPRPPFELKHTPPAPFRRGEPVPVAASLTGRTGPDPVLVLHYRQVNQVAVWQSTPMEKRGADFHATIPAAYIDTPFPIQYYFEVREARERAWLLPGLGPDLCGQPYFVLRQARKTG